KLSFLSMVDLLRLFLCFVNSSAKVLSNNRDYSSLRSAQNNLQEACTWYFQIPPVFKMERFSELGAPPYFLYAQLNIGIELDCYNRMRSCVGNESKVW